MPTSLHDALTSPGLDAILLGVAILLLLSVLGSKASGRAGVPVLLLFIGIGMLAGSEGIGGIYFDDAAIAQALGVIALVFILFGGGLETDWRFVRPSVRRAASLSTIGVALTTVLVGAFCHFILGFTFVEGLLLGAIVSSTDAAAVFAILRSRGVKLKENVAATLEFESGSNDPMAVFLTTALIEVVRTPDAAPLTFAVAFVRQMALGAVAGVVLGFAFTRILQRLTLEYRGLYPVMTVGFVLFCYAGTALSGGNGFLAVYIAGIALGNGNFIQRRSLIRFHDGVAWLMQIVMFLTLGLLVFPSQLVPVAGVGIAVVLFLMFVARPVAVFISLAASSIGFRERVMIAWVGLRGAVPIVLATFPLLAGVPKAPLYFNVVFFIVLASVALQGTTIAPLARLLGLDKPSLPDVTPAAAHLAGRGESALVTVEVAPGSPADGRRLVELRNWPREALILVLYRGNEFFVPDGSTDLRADDRLVVLTSKATVDAIHAMVDAPRT